MMLSESLCSTLIDNDDKDKCLNLNLGEINLKNINTYADVSDVSAVRPNNLVKVLLHDA